MDIRNPIGEFAWSGSQTKQERTAAVNDITFLPQKMCSAVSGLADKQLDTSTYLSPAAERLQQILCLGGFAQKVGVSDPLARYARVSPSRGGE